VKLPELHQGVLIKRYKRFLADIKTQAGTITAHCPNTGAMTGCAEPGRRCWYSLSDNPKRKYPATLEFVETADGLCSVNTGRANKLVGEALQTGAIELGIEKSMSAVITAEAKIPEGNGRFDFLVEFEGQKIFVEVKSVTLHMGDAGGAFPDAVSSRALKHVEALVKRVEAGDRGLLIYCVQHSGINNVTPAVHIDPAYAQAVTQAVARGVEILAYGCVTDMQTMSISRKLAYIPALPPSD